MFGFVDVWWGGVNLTVLLPVLFAPLLLSLQLWLCFKVKSLFARLLPVGLFAVAGGWSCILALTIPGWDSLGYTILAIADGFVLFVCGLGWGVWALFRRWQKRKEA